MQMDGSQHAQSLSETWKVRMAGRKGFNSPFPLISVLQLSSMSTKEYQITNT
jgi:hypothetical protein